MMVTSEVRFIQNGKMGLKDAQGNILIPAIHDFITQFRNGLAGVYSFKEQK